MAAAADQPAPADQLGRHPHPPVIRGVCPTCGAAVLVVRLEGQRVVVLEAQEVAPPQRCPLCRTIEARGQKRGPWCWRCGGTGVIGEALPEPAVRLGPEGEARVYAGEREVGEAVHRLHLH